MSYFPFFVEIGQKRCLVVGGGTVAFRKIEKLLPFGVEITVVSPSFCAEIEQTEQLIQSITGKRPEYLRPPYGAWNEQLECRVNLTTVLWNVDSLDWKFQNTKRIVRRVEKDVKDGDIILMHDIFPTSVEAALRIVDDLQAQGYEFVTVEELLVD